MARANLHTVVHYVRRAAGVPKASGSTDAQLLERFCSRRDEQAFAALVYQHGGLVRSVCRRVLQHDQDAEDAFQATFLVFASKASSIRKAVSVASWLYGVAFRVREQADHQDH
jgi:Sigma-70 region 2